MIYKVLIIEDDLAYKPLWAEILQRHLGGHTAEISWAVSAEEAHVQFERAVSSGQVFDFIITDVFLAGSETGLDFIRNIVIAHQKAPPIILISSADKGEVEDIIKTVSGQIDVMTKPINASQFRDIFNRINENHEVV